MDIILKNRCLLYAKSEIVRKPGNARGSPGEQQIEMVHIFTFFRAKEKPHATARSAEKARCIGSAGYIALASYGVSPPGSYSAQPEEALRAL